MDDEYYDDELDSDSDDLDDTTMPCPICGEEIFDDSPRCPNCGEYITNRSATFWDGKPAWLYVLVVIIVALLVLMFVFPF